MQRRLLKKKKSSCFVITLENKVKKPSFPSPPPAPPSPVLKIRTHLMIRFAHFAI